MSNSMKNDKDVRSRSLHTEMGIEIKRQKVVGLPSTEKMLEIVECPKCFKVNSGSSIYLCKNAHNVCGSCKTKYKACPICKAAMTDFRNYALEAMTDALIYECENTDCPCVLVGSEMVNHLKICEHRPMKCFQCNQDKIAQVFSLLEINNVAQHFISFHKAKKFMLSSWIDFDLADLLPNQNLQPVSFLEYNKKIFFVNSVTTNHGLFIWLSIVGTETTAKDYSSSILIRHVSDSEKSMQWNLRVHSHLMEFKEIMKLEDGIFLQPSEFKSYFNENANQSTIYSLKFILYKVGNKSETKFSPGLGILGN